MDACPFLRASGHHVSMYFPCVMLYKICVCWEPCSLNFRNNEELPGGGILVHKGRLGTSVGKRTWNECSVRAKGSRPLCELSPKEI